MDWDQRVAAVWEHAADERATQVMSAIDALAAQRPDGDAVALYERASARDFAGRAADAESLYRAALDAGLDDVDPRRGVEARVQLASTLRSLNRPEEALVVLESLRTVALPPDQAEWVAAFRALCLASAGRERDALREALAALSTHLTQYGGVVRRYADEL